MTGDPGVIEPGFERAGPAPWSPPWGPAAWSRAVRSPLWTLPAGIAARSEPAAPFGCSSGDWYDAIRLPGDNIAVVVGDCVGSGSSAAPVMTRLRAACRAFLCTAGPARALTQLDAFAESVQGAMCATLCCAVIDQRSGTMTYSSAGHPPGIVVGPWPGPTLLNEGRGLPLATGNVPRVEASTVLAPGASLVLYTDGLVEQENRSIMSGIATAAAVLQAAAARDVDGLADRVMAQLRPGDGFTDDVTVLVYRRAAA
jgi:serine phosphatase RsbU (regulator of sigma subunit)